MMRQFITLVLGTTLTWSCLLKAQGPEDDLCSARPDLCDKNPRQTGKRRPVVKKSKSVNDEFDDALNVESMPAEDRAPARRITAHCRQPHAAYNLNEANLPLCASRAPASAPAAARALAPARTPASAVSSSITFDQYMAENAGHPALSGKIKDHQQAFADTAKPASINFGSEPAPDPAAKPVDPTVLTPAAAAAALAGAGYTLPPGVTIPAAAPAAAGGPIR